MNPSANMHSSYRERLRDRVADYNATDEEALLAFRSAMYGTNAIVAGSAHLRWLYGENPEVSRPPIWLFKKDGIIHAQQCAVPVKLAVRGVERSATWATELMVEPRYRLRGVGAVMLNVCSEGQGLMLGLEVSDDAAKTMLRDGWSELGTLPLFVRPLVPSRLLEKRLRNRWAIRCGSLADLPLRVADGAIATLTRRSTCQLRRVDRFDDRVEVLYRHAVRHYEIIARRDCEVLNWRYRRHPEAERYALYQLENGDELTGVMVARLGDHNGVPSAFIVDYLCPPRLLRSLLLRALPALRASGAAVLYCAQSWRPAASVFKSLGFLERTTGYRMMMRAAPHVDTQLLSPHGRWFTTLGDANLEHSRAGIVFA